MPCTDLTQPIVCARRCKTCSYGVLMYPVEQRRGSCLACQIRARGTSTKWPYPQLPYRTEAEAYDEGIYDDD